jgi:tetratricopeptide (TPR) repeat protein
MSLSQAIQRAVQFHDQGHLDKAERLYAAILALQPGHFDALHRLGILQFQRGHDAEALRYLSAALKAKPSDAVALTHLGLVHAKLRRPDEALASYDKALAFKPNYAQAYNARGAALRAQGRAAEALASYDKALALKPNYAEALNNRGNALRDLARSDEALASYDRAVALKPDYAEAYNNRGGALRDIKRPEAALASYDRALALKPNYAEALNNRGNALRDLERAEDALASYDRALALEPDYAEAHNNRSGALRDLGRSEEALASCDRALALAPGLAEAHNNRGAALLDLNRHAEALTSCERALALKPDYLLAFDNKGMTLIELGRFDEAAIAIKAAIRLAPKRIRSYYGLAGAMRLPPDDPHLRAMEDLARDMPSLEANDQIYLNFALAKAYADTKNHEGSFRHLLDGNALKRKQIAYDEAAALAVFERTRAAFTAELMRGGKELGEPSSVPVFIVGMPRSGTTLVEQILASHPRVFGAGEINDLAKTAIGLGGAVTEVLRAPDAISTMPAEQFRRLGASYVDRIRAMAPSAERVVNKTTENFRFVGLISLALPNARIIHTRRDSIDTCLSCFSHLFLGNFPYTYELGELGRYYRGYDALMTHWQSVLPPNVMLEVQYEEVVADLEGAARRILAHCGLEWDARCLDYHRTERRVRTASAAQVRQPIYKNAIGRWRIYEKFLGPLLAELDAPLASPPL